MMRITSILGVAVCALALAACGEDDDNGNNGTGGTVGQGGSGGDIVGPGGSGGDDIGPGGSGGDPGTGGTGGTGGTPNLPEPREACVNHCTVLLECDSGTLEQCIDWCETSLSWVPDELLEECYTCLDSLSCLEREAAEACLPECTGGYDLLVSSVNLESFEGGTLYWVANIEGQSTGIQAETLTGEPFGFDEYGLFEGGELLNFAWFVDVDGNGACTADDASGRVDIASVADHVEVLIDGEAIGATGCDAFGTLAADLHITSSGFDSWEGTIFFSLLEGTNLVGTGHTALEGEELDLVFEDILLPGSTYRLAYFVDQDDDWACGTEDFVGSVDIDGIGHQTVELTPEDTSDTGCGTDFEWMADMPLGIHITSEGFDTWAGHMVYITILSDGEEVTSTYALLDGEELDLRGQGFENGANYTISYFVDLDDDAACSAADHVSSLDFPAISRPIEAVFRPTDVNDDALCAADFGWLVDLGFHLSVDGTGLDDYEGATVILQAEYFLDFFPFFQDWIPFDRRETTVVDGSVSAMFPHALDDGWEHRVVWFIDVDGDEACSTADVGGVIEGIGPTIAGPDTVAFDAGDIGTAMCEPFADL